MKITERMGDALLVLTVATTLAVGPASAALVSEWRAEGNALDSAGTNHGIAQGGLSYTTGIVGQAFHFNGTNAGISVVNNATLNYLGGDFSIMTWLRFTSHFPAGNNLFLNYGGLQTYFIGLNTADQPFLYARDNTADSVSVTGPTALNDGDWHHIAAVRNGTTGLLYVDGSLVATDSNPNLGVVDVSPAVYVRIGWAATGPTNAQLNATADARFQGDLDEVRIYSHAVSPAEVLAAAAVPEPGTMALLLAGGLAVMWGRAKSR